VSVCVREIQRKSVCEGDREREEALALARPVAPVAHQLRHRVCVREREMERVHVRRGERERE
jgi:hypothetical protein